MALEIGIGRLYIDEKLYRIKKPASLDKIAKHSFFKK